MQTKERLKLLWDQVKDRKVGDVAEDVRTYVQNVKDGADPVEALHGHLCGPGCTHWDYLSSAQRERLMKAPWNQKKA